MRSMSGTRRQKLFRVATHAVGKHYTVHAVRMSGMHACMHAAGFSKQMYVLEV